MKILLTGGGSGGHFYPMIAVGKALYDLAEEERLLTPEIIFVSDKKYSSEIIREYGFTFKKIYAGKARRYFSLLYITDFFKTILGVLKGIWMVYSVMPDVVFGKGGYASFPVLLAAKIFHIPVIIHESDSVPGKVNKWAGKFAKRIALSFSEAIKYFPEEKTALTGTPVRKTILGSTPQEAIELFTLDPDVPTILILGGSQGSQKINDTIIEILKDSLEFSQIIHQCGAGNEQEVRGRTDIILENSAFKNRYHLYSYLDDSLLRNASSVSNLVVSRAGGTAIYEIAAWGIPSILIPLKNSAQDHQKENAYSYARAGGGEVIEEENLTPHVLLSEIQRFLADKEKLEIMRVAAKNFARPDASRKIAQEIINLGLQHSQ